MSPDDLVRRAARSQSGFITRAQALDCGLTKRQVDGRHRTHGWERVLPGVYRLPGAPEGPEHHLRAIALWIGDGGYVYGPTAAYCLGLDGIPAPGIIHVALWRTCKLPGIKVHRLRADDRPRLRRLDGVPLPWVERTILETCAVASPTAAGLALDDALRRRLTTIDRLWGFCDSTTESRRAGSRLLRQLLRGRDDRDGKVRTLFETKMLRILKRIKEHHFEPDYRLVAANRTRYLDFYLPTARLGIECHSQKWHGPERSAGDIRRDREISALGIELLYFDWDEVSFDPGGVEAEIRSAISRRLTPAGLNISALAT